ncbi:hypothetical protein ElyMa_006378000 [Elysia marginata]|uniref:Uncharacterized protein n=1 Tax=Elysia marginata TaxID=1093978 RepID=A0AAV4HN47_9GAST|nr:hypothetical protein ElyMa_006378000 [Elysia marginata]
MGIKTRNMLWFGLKIAVDGQIIFLESVKRDGSVLGNMQTLRAYKFTGGGRSLGKRAVGYDSGRYSHSTF